MKKHYFLFDMDGVLLNSLGYHRGLQTSLERIAASLGYAQSLITDDQIARFEAMNVTNEWDTVAICTALVLVAVWQVKEDIRIDLQNPSNFKKTEDAAIDQFLDRFNSDEGVPGEKALNIILELHPWLNPEQKSYLAHVLLRCRDIFTSPTLPIHVEIILGSRLFHDHYHLAPQLDEESFLLRFDRSTLNSNTQKSINALLSLPTHFACVMTNRPNGTPPGFLSSPEAELGVKCIGIDGIPYIGSGILGWYAHTKMDNAEHTLLKPNPIHALASLRMCLGESTFEAIDRSVKLWQGTGNRSDWNNFAQSKVVVFEDSTKGLLSAVAARELLLEIGISLELELIGVSANPIKSAALDKVADQVFREINDVNWDRYRS